ncbi:subtilisin family serine protease [Anoxybacillus mongoliensis]|uniref:Subtilisin family serine protease n=1 Tax=Anoxybacillus mongoliensis TaxID=452565 RepID=A0A7W8JGH9_9BACL|nr:S8 family peptidase [Anoxybacillus mongoliensis]MBB5355308.1 subtilisin family serine protease [Anoxybacillus mongoliensis]
MKKIILLILSLSLVISFYVSKNFFKTDNFKTHASSANDGGEKSNYLRLIDNSRRKLNDMQLLMSSKRQIIPWGVNSVGTNKLLVKQEPVSKVKVAILDSGINREHEDLKGKVVEEFNAINPGQPLYDTYGHGTAIAGIIAASDNEIGIRGVSPNVEIYSVKVLDDKGRGKVRDLVRGIQWCIDNRVQVMNISFGMSSDNSELREAIETAINSGIIVVAAAGNNYGGKTDYPANYKDVISVTAVNSNYKMASFSARGKIDFSAPGVDILTTSNNGGYGMYSGTSLAAAYVTGIVAIILEEPEQFGISKYKKNKKFSSEMINILRRYSVKIGNKTYYGNGFVKLS